MQLRPRHGHSGDFTPSELAEMLVDPYDDAPKYTKAIIGAVCGVILLAALVNRWSRYKLTETGAKVASKRPILRLTAAVRYLATAPTPTFSRYLHFPTRGVVFLLTVFWTFVLVWSFAVTPYYRSRWNVGSPPLAIRTGMMALGVFPFILAFGAKWNLVTFVTGYSHEKLQVFHQWFSQLFFVLSLLHTFPFVMAGREIRPNKDGLNPKGLTQIGYSWHIGKVYYWTGVAMLITLTWLCYASLTPLRQRWYEMFKLLHIISAILFSAFFYLHCNALLTSWDYLYATAGLYGISVVMRFGLMLFRNGRGIPQAQIEVLPGDAVRLTIPTPKHQWKAGQHVFVNFCKTRLLESHPYTISNDANIYSHKREMVIVLKTDVKGGIGARLASLEPATTPVLLDGPYGSGADLSRHHVAVLVAGGSGASFVVSILHDLCRRSVWGELQTKHIILHWVVRNEACRAWFEDQINAAIVMAPKGMVQVHLHVTGVDAQYGLQVESKADGSDAGEAEKRCRAKPSRPHPAWTISNQRPYLPSLLESAFELPGCVGIASCGPTSFTDDVRRAVASKQKSMALGHDVRDVELHTEEFDW